MLGRVGRDVDADLSHNFHCQGMHVTGRIRARTDDFGGGSASVLKEAFTHVASARVARAQDQDRCHDAEKVFAEKLVVETARTCSVPRAVQRIF
jgi:hypothetical protein